MARKTFYTKEVIFRIYTIDKNFHPRLRKSRWFGVVNHKSQRRRQFLRKILPELEKLGFVNLLTYRIGPCERCHSNEEVYWDPVRRAWLCPVCFYHSSVKWSKTAIPQTEENVGLEGQL
jgi:hypothetical protein